MVDESELRESQRRALRDQLDNLRVGLIRRNSPDGIVYLDKEYAEAILLLAEIGAAVRMMPRKVKEKNVELFELLSLGIELQRAMSAINGKHDG